MRDAALKGCGQVVTVWNRFRDLNGKDAFIRHVIPVLCNWKESVRRAETRAQGQGVAASVSQSLTVIVPYSGEYRPYDIWKDLSDADKRRFFTLHVTDLLALGEYDLEITGEGDYTETGVKKLLGTSCAVISAFSDNTGLAGAFGAVFGRVRRGGHYKVGCYYGFKSRF